MILCLETAFDTCSVALFDPQTGKLIASDTVPAKRKHTEMILPMVSRLMSDQGLSLSELKSIAFNRGPGAFTGLRINTAAAQGLATALGINCIPVSSLMAIAAAALKASDDTSAAGIVSVIDARMDEFYLASYHQSSIKELVQLDEEQLMATDTAAHWLAQKSADGFKVVSPEAQRINTVMQKLGLEPVVLDQGITAVDIAQISRSVDPVEPHLAQPVYLRHNAWKTIEQQKSG